MGFDGMPVYLCWVYDCSRNGWKSSWKNIHLRMDGREVWKGAWSSFWWLKNSKRRVPRLRFRKIHNGERLWNLVKIQLVPKSALELHGEHFTNSLSFNNLRSLLSCNYSCDWRYLFHWKINLHFWISCRRQNKNVGSPIRNVDSIPPSFLHNCKPCNVSHQRLI